MTDTVEGARKDTEVSQIKKRKRITLNHLTNSSLSAPMSDRSASSPFATIFGSTPFNCSAMIGRRILKAFNCPSKLVGSSTDSKTFKSISVVKETVPEQKYGLLFHGSSNCLVQSIGRRRLVCSKETRAESVEIV